MSVTMCHHMSTTIDNRSTAIDGYEATYPIGKYICTHTSDNMHTIVDCNQRTSNYPIRQLSPNPPDSPAPFTLPCQPM